MLHQHPPRAPATRASSNPVRGWSESRTECGGLGQFGLMSLFPCFPRVRYDLHGTVYLGTASPQKERREKELVSVGPALKAPPTFPAAKAAPEATLLTKVSSVMSATGGAAAHHGISAARNVAPSCTKRLDGAPALGTCVNDKWGDLVGATIACAAFEGEAADIATLPRGSCVLRIPNAGLEVSLSVALPTDETIFWSHPTRLAPGFLWPDSDSMQVEIRPLHEAGAAAGSTGRRYRVSWEDSTRTVHLEAQDNNLGRLGPLRLPRAIQGGSFEWGLFNGAQCTLLLYGRGFSQPEPYDIVFSGHVHGACGLPFARGLGERTVGPKHWGRRGKENKPLMLSGLWEIDELRMGGKLCGRDGEVPLKGHRECLECLDVYCARTAPTSSRRQRIAIVRARG